MMILKIKEVREEDGPSIGADLLHLGQLNQAGLSVPEGIIMTAPEIHLKTALDHFNLKDREIFEQRLTLIKDEIVKIPPPEELDEEFNRRHLDQHKLWLHLLDFWLSVIRDRIWREGFSPDLTRNLPAQPIFFMDKISASGKAYFDYERGLLMVDVESGKLTDPETAGLEKMIKEGNKKLMLPQIYDWSLEKKLYLVKVSPFTHYLPKDDQPIPLSQFQTVRLNQKSTIKILQNIGLNFQNQLDLDGAILSSENITDFDTKLLQLIEISQTLPNQPVIFKLFDKKDHYGHIRGTQYLIHEKSILKKDVEALHFLRNKKYCNNIHLGIPFVRSTEELKELKQELLALKISRSVSLKFWLELAVPENLLNIEKYLDVGVDGVMLNCNELASWIGGFDPDEPDSIYYKGEIAAFLKIVGQTLPKLHQEKIPVIATGSLALHDDVLDFLIEKGIWGLGVDGPSVIQIHDRIRLIERRLLHRRS